MNIEALESCIEIAEAEGYNGTGRDARKEIEDLLEWTNAITEACIVNWIPITTPKETIQALINCVVQEALDPKISKSAQDLIDQGKREGTNEYPD